MNSLHSWLSVCFVAELSSVFGTGSLPNPPPQDPFDRLPLPALEFRSRTAKQWRDAFLESGCCSREALWSIFYWNDRSPEVLEILRRELERSRQGGLAQSQHIVGWDSNTGGALHREVDAILDHWGIEHDCLTLEEYWDPTMVDCDGRHPVDVFALPTPFLEGSTEELLELLESNDRSERAFGEDPAEETDALWRVLEAGDQEEDAYPSDFFSDAMYAIDELELDASRFPDWGIAQLSNYWNVYSYHQDAIGSVLTRMELTRRQQATLCHMEVDFLGGGWSDLLTFQGGAATERVVDVRRGTYLGFREMQNVLKITRLSKLDEQYLILAMRQGPAMDRELALGWIREFDLDTPALQEAVKERIDDGDNRVRGAAVGLCDSRGW